MLWNYRRDCHTGFWEVITLQKSLCVSRPSIVIQISWNLLNLFFLILSVPKTWISSLTKRKASTSTEGKNYKGLPLVNNVLPLLEFIISFNKIYVDILITHKMAFSVFLNLLKQQHFPIKILLDNVNRYAFTSQLIHVSWR